MPRTSSACLLRLIAPALLPLALACGGGGSASNPPPAPPPQIGSFTATPATIEPGGRSTLTWSVSGASNLSIDHGVGAVAGSSLNVSPAVTTAYTLTATNSSGSASAVATVTVATTPPVAVSVAPAAVDLAYSGTQTFTATVSGSSNQNVTWSVDGSGSGSITPGGVYTAPSTTGAYTVRATSVADPLKSGTAAVNVSSPPPGRVLRVYVAGESIEEYNRFTAPPFNTDGSLNDLGPMNNDGEQYGWMVPFADRLRVRSTGVSVVWVGASPWTTRAGTPSTGTYPSSTPGMTSAIAGTTIEDWLSQRQAELVARTYAYDIAFAARAGNDLNGRVGEIPFKASLTALIRALDAGSSSRAHPTVYVTAHMPDGNGWNYNTDPASIAAWNAAQRQMYVTWTSDVIQSLRNTDPAIRMVLVDQYSAFMANQPTTAFPHPAWVAANGGADLAKIHIDDGHPKRLASIYAGEVAADSLLPADLQ